MGQPETTPPLRLPGRRVVLRDWELHDLDPYRAFEQPGQDWHTLDGPYYARATSEQVEQKLERIGARIRNRNWPDPRQVIVVADAETDLLIGRVSWYWQSEETQWLSLGVVIFDSGNWRRGLGYEALGLWSQYLWDSMPEIARLDLRTWSGNVGMMRLAEKLGFALEARFRQARIVDGEYFDGLGYGMLRSEWEVRYSAGFVASL